MPVICSHQGTHVCLEVGGLAEGLCAAVHTLDWPSPLPDVQCNQVIGFFGCWSANPQLLAQGSALGEPCHVKCFHCSPCITDGG